MAGAFTAKAVFLIPSIAWDTSLTIAPSRECLKIKRLKKETMLPEDIPDTLYLGVNGREELRIAARDEDGKLHWVKPADYTCNFNNNDCLEVYKFAYGLKLLRHGVCHFYRRRPGVQTLSFRGDAAAG